MKKKILPSLLFLLSFIPIPVVWAMEPPHRCSDADSGITVNSALSGNRVPQPDSLVSEYNRDTISNGPLNEVSSSGTSQDSLAKKSKTISQRLEAWSSRFLITRELHNIVVVPTTHKPLKDTLKIIRSEIQYYPYAGKTIRHIRYLKLLPFGASVDDTLLTTHSFLEKTANSLHTRTLDHVIRQSLLFRSGDTIDPTILADNERVLRELGNIEDARIHVIPAAPLSDSVDILIITKDVWSKAFNLDVSALDAGRFDLWDKNIAGSGHEISASAHWDKHESPPTGFSTYYRIRNIAGSFIDGKVYYNSIFDSKSYGIDLARNFFVERLLYAGGAQVQHLDELRSIRLADTLLEKVAVRGNTLNLWLGRSIPIQSQNLLTRDRSNIIVTAGIFNDYYTVRPPLDATMFYPYQNKVLLLGSIGFSQQNFYKTNLIYSFGVTEDIPYGSLLKLTFGTELNEFNSRLYAAYGLSRGDYLLNIGYLYTNMEIGGFISHHQMEQGVVNLEASFFSNLLVIKRFSIRHFIYANFKLGINRFNDEFITINDNNGIRGFVDYSVVGDQKFVTNLESVLFTPFSLLNFRIAMYGFADLAWITPQKSAIFNSQTYSCVGAGVRMRNDRLVFNTFQLSAGYYPVTPAEGSPVIIKFSAETRLVPRNFFMKAPGIIKFF